MPIKYLNRNNNSTAISAGNSVLFNGTDQCLTVPSNAAFNFGTGDFTLEAWVYWTSTATSVGGQRIFLQGVAGTTEIGINYNATKFDIDINNLTRFSYTYAISTGQWYHIALVRRSTNVYELFVNGTSQGTNTYTYSQNANNFIIGGLTWASNYGTNGYISNVRILKGTALYTSSFSVPTAPLTAIANTSLLTCQSPTIVDNSTNNFTITNNGAATVSSTVPFTASFVPAPSVMKFTNRFNAETVLAGTQKAIFGYGSGGGLQSLTNLVNNTGVVSTDTAGVGTERSQLAAAGYGSDKAIFGYGRASNNYSMTNLVSNTGVVSTDTTGVGTARNGLAAASYGSDKAIFGYGYADAFASMTNLVSNTGVVATDTTGVGTARFYPAAAGFSSGTIPAPSVMKFTNRFTDAVVSIVTSGLVLNLDASNASSYPGSGTSWFDLSGNSNNGTLTNGPTFNSANGGSIVFDGSNDYATLGASIPTNLRLGQGNFTIDFWVYPNGTGTYSICGNLNDADGGGSYWVIINSTYAGLHTVQFGYAGIFDVGAGYKFGTTALPINVWSNVILSRIGTTMTCYINGSSYATPITVNNFTGNFNIDYLIGMSKSGGGFSSYPLNGRLAILRIYNGVGFTQSEISQNYNATRARFGL